MQIEYELEDEHMQEIAKRDAESFIRNDSVLLKVKSYKVGVLLFSLLISMAILFLFSGSGKVGIGGRVVLVILVIVLGFQFIKNMEEYVENTYRNEVFNRLFMLYKENPVKWILKDDCIINYIGSDKDIIKNEEIIDIYVEDEYINLIVEPERTVFLIPIELIATKNRMNAFVSDIKSRIV